MKKWIILDLMVMYLVACADDTGGNEHTVWERIGRVVFWPITVTNFFREQPQQLSRLLTITWVMLTVGWTLSLLADRL